MGDEERDDDWFENAFGEDTDGEDGAESAESGADAPDDAGEAPEDDERERSDSEASSGEESEDPFDGDSEESFDEEPEDLFGEESESPFDEDSEEPFGSAEAFDGESEEDDLFEDDFSDAFAGAEGSMGGSGGGMDGMGGSGGGMGGMGGGTEDFEAEEFESDIPRITIGIEGLDEMIQGGVPDRSLMVVMGSAGTGKTTFGLQFIGQALENGERAAFITLEENRERIINTAEEKGWEFEEHVENGDLAIVDLDPVEMANSLASIRNELPALVREFGASRLVLDSVSLLELMYDDQATRRTEVYQFTKALKDAGVTTMVTSEASKDDPFTSRYGIIEYLTDAVFVLRYLRGDNFQETRLAVEIQKIRDANHSRETKPYEITNTGISVYRQANIF